MPWSMAKEKGDVDVSESPGGDSIAGISEWSRGGVVLHGGLVELIQQTRAKSGPADDRDASEVAVCSGHG